MERKSGLRRNYRALKRLGLLLVIVFLGVGIVQARKKRKQQTPADLQGHVAALASQLEGVPLDESGDLTNRIERLALAHLDAWMANRSPNIAEVQREIDNVFSQLHYPAYENSAAFKASWKGRDLLAAGYTLGWSDIWRVNVVQLFECRDGHSRPVAVTHFLPGVDLHYLMLPVSAAGDFRLIIYGSKLGKSHPRLSAVLYSFDGQKLQSSWQIQDKFDGKLSVKGDNLVIRYLLESEFVHATAARSLPPQHEIVYKITPEGMVLETDHVIS